MKVSVDDKSLKNVEDNIRKSFEKVIRNQTLMRELSDTIIKDIQVQTRMGKSIPLEQKMASITNEWKDRRKTITSEKHQAFSPGRSNLTVSGQLLNSLQSFFVSAGKFVIRATGIHQQYTYKKKNGETSQIGNRVENERLARYVAEQGRPFIGVRKELIPRLKRIIIGYIRRSSKVISKTDN